jgi:hypothetical protein
MQDKTDNQCVCHVCGYVACGHKVCVQITRSSEGSIIAQIERLCAPCTKWALEA